MSGSSPDFAILCPSLGKSLTSCSLSSQSVKMDSTTRPWHWSRRLCEAFVTPHILKYCCIVLFISQILIHWNSIIFNGHILIFDTDYNLVSFDVCVCVCVYTHIYTCEIIPTTIKIVNTSIIPQSFLVSLFNPFLQTLPSSLHPIHMAWTVSVPLQTRSSSFWHQVANKSHQDVGVEELAEFTPVLKASLPHCMVTAQTM